MVYLWYICGIFVIYLWYFLLWESAPSYVLTTIILTTLRTDMQRPIVEYREISITVFNTLCSATSVHSIGNRCSISLDHHLYNNICDQWLQRSSQQQPFIKMKVAIHPDDYTALGFNLNRPPKISQVQVMADTGCQSCLAGITILDQLCISRRTSSQ